MLRELNCDLVQGYLFGRPQPATEVAATILRAFGPSRRRRSAAGETVATRSFR